MKTLTHLLMVVVAAGLMLAFASTAMAQEKAKAEKAKTAQDSKAAVRAPSPVLFENERVRVTESRIKPGENNGMKMRSDRVNVSINPGKTRVHYPDGKKEDFDLKAGSVRFNKAGTSSTENIGKTETRTVIVTLK